MTMEKFKALVHFVIDECDDPTRLGATRLNKILWYSDVIAYKAEGNSISGEAYVKRQHGPVPRHVLNVLRSLQKDGAIVMRERPRWTYSMHEYISARPADRSALSEIEQEIVRNVMDVICGDHTASSISELSHDRIWKAAALGEEIPLYATLAAEPGEITGKVKEWGRKMVREVEGELQQAD